MALPQTRQTLIGEEPLDLGLMSLPGANATVANPAVVNNLTSQAATQTPTTTAKDLFDYYATGYNPDQAALDFWNSKISNLGYENTLSEFLNPKQGAAAPRFAAMSADPDFIRAGGQQVLDAIAKTATPVIPAGEQPGAREIVDSDMVVGDTTQQTADNIAKAQQLFETYATGFDPGQEGLDFWAQQYAKEGATEADVLNQFLNPQKGANAPRTFLMQADPDYVAAMKAAQPAVDTTNFPKFEGRAYDPKAYDTIAKQLTAQQQLIQQKTGFDYGSSFGGAKETIDDMAKRLAASGISDIRDFGQRYSVAVEPVYETVSQDEGPSMTFDTGKYRTITGIEGYTGEGEPIYKYRELTPSEMKRLKFDDSGMAFLDATKADIESNPFAESVYYNKKTGEIIDKRKIGGKAESGIWGSSGAGDGYTNYRVQFNEQGIPIFYPEKELSGMKEFVAKDLPGILSVLRFIPGAQIPVMLAQAGAAAYMGAKPGDILKNLATTAIASNIGNILAKGVPGTDFKGLPSLGIDLPTSDLGKMIFDAGSSGLASLIKGGDLETALKSAGLSFAGSGVRSLLPATPTGELDYGKVLTALAPAIADGKLSNADVFRLIQAAVPTKPQKTPGKP